MWKSCESASTVFRLTNLILAWLSNLQYHVVMPLQIVHKMLCDKGMERFVGREAQEYPLSDGPKPSFIVRKIQLDGSFRDYLFDGTPCSAPEVPLEATASPQAPQPVVTKAIPPEPPTAQVLPSHSAQPAPASSVESGIQVNRSELTPREAVWLGANPLLEEIEEEEDFEADRCSVCGCTPYLGCINEEELLAMVDKFLDDKPKAGPAIAQPEASVAPEFSDSCVPQSRRQEQRQEALKKADEAPRCIHIKSDGRRCGSAAIAGDPFCYFHGEARARRAAQAQLDALGLPVLEDRRSLQIAIMQVNALAASQTLDDKTARLLFTGLRLAQRNLAPNGTLEERKKYRRNTEVRSE